MTGLDEKFIKSEHKKYQDIYKIKLPDLLYTISSDENNDFHANVRFDKCFVLTVNTLIGRYNEQFVRSILYHEFTHQLDYINCPLKNNEKLFPRYMKVYSEIHASEIKIRTLLNKPYASNLKFVESIVSYNNISIKLSQFLYIELQRINIIEDQPQNIYNFKEFKKFITEIIKSFYYIGYCNIFNNNINQKLIKSLKTRVHDQSTYTFLMNVAILYRKNKIYELVCLFEDFYYKYGTLIIRKEMSSFGMNTEDIDIYNYKSFIKNAK